MMFYACLWCVLLLCSEWNWENTSIGSKWPQNSRSGYTSLKGQIILLAKRLWCSQEEEPEREPSPCQKLLQMEEPVCLGSPWLWEEPFGKVVGRSCLAAWMLETVLGWSESGMQQRWLVEQITIWWAGCCSSCCSDREEQVPIGEAKLSVTWSDRHNRISPLLLYTAWARGYKSHVNLALSEIRKAPVSSNVTK